MSSNVISSIARGLTEVLREKFPRYTVVCDETVSVTAEDPDLQIQVSHAGSTEWFATIQFWSDGVDVLGLYENPRWPEDVLHYEDPNLIEQLIKRVDGTIDKARKHSKATLYRCDTSRLPR